MCVQLDIHGFLFVFLVDKKVKYIINVSMFKKIVKVFFIILLLFLGYVGVFFVQDELAKNNIQREEIVLENTNPIKKIKIKKIVFSVEVADTEKARVRGLSNHGMLGVLDGMLFVFEKPGVNFFWMKDMLFPIDIIWMDADKKIFYIVEDARPASYPQQFGIKKDSLYVLELPAGTVGRMGFAIGDTVEFLKQSQ